MLHGALEEHVGRVLGGRYRLVAPLGSGASAQVYLADDTTLRRRVAVKVLHRALADDEAFLRRFRAEAQAAAALNHPHIVAVHDWGEDDQPYLVSEYLAGGSLRGMLDAGHRLTPSQALRVGLEAARALEHAHRRGFVHRDIKPDNLLFDDEGRLRIADFGVARALAEAAWTEPAGALLGTVRYASPEQARGLALDGRSDVYALALSLHEAVTGEVPFQTDSTLGTLMARVDQPFPHDERLGALGPAVEAAGSPDPAERPDAAQLIVKLMAAASRLPRPEPLPLVGARPAGEGSEREDLRTALAVGSDRLLIVDVDEPDDPEVDDDEEVLALFKSAGRDRRPDPPAPPSVAPVPEKKSRRQKRAEKKARRKAVAKLKFGTRRRRRRWPLVAALVIVVAAVGAGAAAWLALQPEEHAIPPVLGLDEEAATAALDDLGFEVVTVEGRLDDSRPGEVIAVDPPVGQEREEGDTVIITVSRGNELRPVPEDLAGLSLPEATRRLEEAELTVGQLTPQHDETVPPDHVVAVATRATEVPRDDGVDLIVSIGPEPRIVPEGLEGAAPEQAIAALAELRLVGQAGEEYNAEVPAGQVIRLDPAPGTELPADSIVYVVVSKGPEPKPFPRVIGLSVDEAEQRIAAVGVSISTVAGPPNGQVTGSSILEGEPVVPGQKVSLTTR